jgi:putative NADH-flavin reductase
MKVAVLGASGRAGSEIAAELARRGHEVVAISRTPGSMKATTGITPVNADARDPTALAGILRGSDAVISALTFEVSAQTLLTALRQAGIRRLLVTGGAASLKSDQGERMIDSADFPEAWKPVAMRGVDFLTELKQEQEIDWVFFSPAFYFVAGARTGQFRLGKDHLIANDAGDSRISFADYAIAMVDELEQHRHSRERFTIGY